MRDRQQINGPYCALYQNHATQPCYRRANASKGGHRDVPPDADCIDFLFFTHGRHEGNAEAARQYLAWETGLIAQLDAQERGAFRIA